ncbi:MAG: hypothetical protein HC844_18830 [Tabrizicola sp.]|nr:hypothetical protein [Tabrizicola sp.]
MLRPLALTLALSLSPAFAEDISLPYELQSIIDEAESYCDGEFSMADGSVQQTDLNGDGTLDWILDSGGFRCSTAATLYCGTQGCGIDTLIDGTLGALLLHDWGTVTEGGVTYLTAPNDAGETVRFLWTGREWALQ